MDLTSIYIYGSPFRPPICVLTARGCAVVPYTGAEHPCSKNSGSKNPNPNPNPSNLGGLSSSSSKLQNPLNTYTPKILYTLTRTKTMNPRNLHANCDENKRTTKPKSPNLHCHESLKL
eukprot:TRINITY_DN1138_c0_g1_i6.p1 TRINITY_DN1138_c0_g1~~TRINITY_DN1138_c0_g1_i6.p1  ORF type:complete len:118 (-),score=3.34 TRINITY_DN1138_c0_g1_i6:400-753(-)